MLEPSKQLRNWTKKRTLVVVYALAALIAVSLLIWGGYAAPWTGFMGKTLWEWLQLLVIPVVLASAALWFNWQQSKVEREIGEQRRIADLEIAEQHRKVDLEIAADQQRESILQDYLNHMSELLLDKDVKLRDSKEDDVIRDVARIRTLTVLRRLDSERKGVVLRFLCEAGLIKRGGWHVVLGGGDLSGANLNNAALGEVELGGANLSKANLSAATLTDSSLWKANLSEADLSGAILMRADLHRVNLRGANLSNAWMVGVQLNSADLTEANLTGANLSEAYLYGTLDGADLSGADLTKAEAPPGTLEKVKSLKGATMPDGTKHK